MTQKLSRSRLLHSLHVLRLRERRGTLLESAKLRGLRHDGRESQSGLDVGDVLLPASGALLLRCHLSRERLLVRRVPLASSRKDVLEGLLRVAVRRVGRGLTGLQETEGLGAALGIRLLDGLRNPEGFPERGRIAEDVARSRSTRTQCLLCGPLQAGRQRTSLSQFSANLTLQFRPHRGRHPGVAQFLRQGYPLVLRGRWRSLLDASGARTQIG